MKKTIKLLVVMAVVVVITAVTGGAALASNYDAQADALKELGLFRGTSNGNELERIPTRAESAVAVVRLLGKESEVQAGTYEMPFTDVPDWAAHSVGYLYVNNLANGSTATTFGAGDACSTQMFTTFVLRALGYNESNGDFTYDQALEYAAGIGLIKGADSSDEFKRDDLAAISYSALFQPIKGSGGTTLLEKLIADKAVDAAAADKYMASYKTYQSLLEASAKNNAKSMQMSSDMNMQMKLDGQTQTVTQKMEIAVVPNGKDYKMRRDSTTELLGTTLKVSMYYADGWMYMDTSAGKYKSQYALTSDELGQMTQQSGLREAQEPYYLIQSITKADTGAGMSYQVVYSAPAENGMLDSILSQVIKDGDSADVQINALEMLYLCDSSGNLQSISMTGDIVVAAPSGQEVATIGLTFQSKTKIIATGSSVTVTPPADLTAYKTMDDPGQ